MKKTFLLISVMILFAATAFSQPYFVELTKGAVSKFDQKGFIFGATAATGAADSVSAIVSQPFGYQSATNKNPRNAFAGTKIMAGCNITVAFDDVVATFTLQASPDATNWIDIVTLDSDVTPNVTGYQWYVADLANFLYPFYRLKFNASGLEVEVLGRVQLLYLVNY